MNSEQQNAILALDGPARYKHFIKQVVDHGLVWGLYQSGWALAATCDGAETIPFWPGKQYAILCAHREWKGFVPKEINLQDFLEDWIPGMEEDKTQPGIFYTPTDKGVIPTTQELLCDLQSELLKYE